LALFWQTTSKILKMNYRVLFVISISLGFCLSVQAQRLGSDIKRELPKTLYIAGGAETVLKSVAEHFTEEKRSFDLQYIDLKEFQKKVLDPNAFFVLPFKTKTVNGDYFTMAMVAGSENAKEQKMSDDGLFLRDRNMPLVVEVQAQSDWINTEMVLLYVSALEGLHKQGKTLSQSQTYESLLELKKGKWRRVLIMENSVIEPLRTNGKFSYVVQKGGMYSSPLELLKNEDIFDAGTIVITAFDHYSERVRACYSFDKGLCFFQHDELDPDLGFLINGTDLKSTFKYLLAY